MRLIVGGGRATEDSESKGSVIVGVRTLSEGGCVGNFSREQVSSLVFYHINLLFLHLYYLHVHIVALIYCWILILPSL
jgi:hypothetical protein